MKISNIGQGLLLWAFLAVMLQPAAANAPADDAGRNPWIVGTESYEGDYTGVSVASGMLGLLPWKEPFSVRHVMLNHVFERGGADMLNTAVRGINPFGLVMYVDGNSVDGRAVSGWKQELDMYSAEHRTRFTAFGKVEVEYSFVALRNLPYSMLMNVSLKALDDTEVLFENSMQVPEEYGEAKRVSKVVWADGHRIELMKSMAPTAGGRYEVAASSMYVPGEGFARECNGESDILKTSMKKGESRTFSVVSSVCSSKDFSDPSNEADRQLVYIEWQTPQKILAAHRDMWEELWTGDIEIEGDPEAWQAVRLALYNLYSFCREGSRLSISPMGLSSQGYYGHIFWDTELWMYPPMLLLNQGIARSMIDYRTDRADAARRRAVAYGYEGVFYPWESDGFGEESTPVWAITGPMEHHITADIGIAAWNYYCVTRDRKWLAEYGFPLLKDVADFWVCRADRNEDGTFSVRGVVGADEYAHNVTDNAFTNGAAICALRAAVKAAKICGEKVPDEWTEVADGLRILKGSGGVTLEYEGYDGRMIKQADANLLGYPLGIIKDRKRLLNDLEYYEDRIDQENGPAMSYSIFCIQYARMGDAEKAEEMFRRCYRPNMRPPFGVLAETPVSHNPYFATAAGGLLQAVLNGFGGLEITEKGVVMRKPLLPPSWKKLTIRGIGPQRKTYVIEN